MREDHEGERELVLGNRQLLGIFFVAALLCGVFFVMGYVVGGNSAKAGAAAAAAADSSPAPSTDGKREEPQPPPANDSAALSASGVSGAQGDTGSPLPGAEPRVMDNPAALGAQPPAPVPVAATPAQNKSTVPAASVPPAATGVFISEPEKGASYWQVAAETRPDADKLVRMMRERQLPAILADSSNPKLFRVLVGPYRSTLTLADAKKKLIDLGFDGLIIQKY
jgi:hypothetical protein